MKYFPTDKALKDALKALNLSENAVIQVQKDDPLLSYLKRYQKILLEDDAEEKPYLNTTENQEYLLQLLKGNVETAFTVLSGGDHVFNLLSQGVLTIDTCDTNDLQKLVFDLKCASIRTLKYNEFEDFLLIRTGYRFFSKEMWNTVKDGFLKEEELSKRYWDAVINSTPNDEIKEFIFRGGVELTGVDKTRKSLFYAKKRRIYEQTKENLEKATITFQHQDALDALLAAEKTYDYIDLMSILYFIYQLREKEEYLESIQKVKQIYEEKLNPGGSMVVDYFFGTDLKELETTIDPVKRMYQANLKDLESVLSLYSISVEGIPGTLPLLHPGKQDVVVYTKK